jgi:hypothetical protein
MPLHDWTRVSAGLFHHFHQGWCWEISGALNRGQLPDGYTALVEQRSGTKEPDVLAIEERLPDVDPVSNGGAIAVRERPQAKYVVRSEKLGAPRRHIHPDLERHAEIGAAIGGINRSR